MGIVHANGFGSRRSKWYGAAVVAGAALIAAAGCSSTTGSSSSGGGTVKSGGTLTFALDEDVPGFNSLAAGDNEFVLAEIQDQTLPRVYVVQPNLKPVLDTEVVTSASVVKTNPQTIVYQINPRPSGPTGCRSAPATSSTRGNSNATSGRAARRTRRAPLATATSRA